MTTRHEPSLRPAGPGDFAFAWELYRDLMRPLTLALLGSWQDEGQRPVVRAGLASGDARIVVVDGVDVGWLQARERDGRVELLQIYVAPAWQGRGLGTALVEDLKGELPVELSVMRNNVRALALYERLGFEIVATSASKHLMRWTPTRPASRRPPADAADGAPG